MTGQTLAQVFGDHAGDDRESGYYCACGWKCALWTHGETRDAHAEHLAVVALAWVIERLGDEESVAAQVHAAWMETKRAQGVTSRPSEWGEEQMVPYADLSERAKDLDRSTVTAALAAVRAHLGTEVES